MARMPSIGSHTRQRRRKYAGISASKSVLLVRTAHDTHHSPSHSLTLTLALSLPYFARKFYFSIRLILFWISVTLPSIVSKQAYVALTCLPTCILRSKKRNSIRLRVVKSSTCGPEKRISRHHDAHVMMRKERYTAVTRYPSYCWGFGGRTTVYPPIKVGSRHLRAGTVSTP